MARSPYVCPDRSEPLADILTATHHLRCYDVCMRTTVTLDPDAEQIVRARMAAKGQSFKRALNDTIREGAAGRADIGFSTTTYDLGPPSVDLTKATQIAGELEDEELMAKQRAGR